MLVLRTQSVLASLIVQSKNRSEYWSRLAEVFAGSESNDAAAHLADAESGPGLVLDPSRFDQLSECLV
eukprot:5520523-Alexandrium_andersonii.AAC.1